MISAPATAQQLTPAEARAIAKEAYDLRLPARRQLPHPVFVLRGPRRPRVQGALEHDRNKARVYTPDDKAIQTPNSDTPYSLLGADLRAEPLVLTVPAIEQGRYYSLQFIDMYTFNFAYVGSRATGNDAGQLPARRAELEGRERRRASRR